MPEIPQSHGAAKGRIVVEEKMLQVQLIIQTEQNISQLEQKYTLRTGSTNPSHIAYIFRGSILCSPKRRNT